MRPLTTLDTLDARLADRGCAPAILAPDHEPVSYVEYHARVYRAGDALAALGFGRGSRIATALPNGPDAVVATLAALSWASAAPLDPDDDAATSAMLLREMRVDALIVRDGDALPVVTAAEAAGIPVLRLAALDSGGFELRGDTGRAPVARSRPRLDDLVLVSHTSGTTAKRKIVPHTQRSLMSFAGWDWLWPSDRFLCLHPLFTTSGLGNGLLGPLLSGASAVLPRCFDAERFFDWLAAFEPTYFSASPTVHRAILEQCERRAPRVPSSLRFVRSSSNAMSEALQRSVEAALGVPVIQGYGSTETGIIANDSPLPGMRRPGSVGRPSGIEVGIADEEGRARPPGVVGEILVRGPTLMPGYENDPEANRAAFRDGWFRTGDLGYFDADGYLYIAGRVRELINRGGIKVAPAEVDAVLAAHPAVRDAATVAVPHPSLGEDIVTAIMLRPGASATADELRRYARENLAAQKVPTTVVFVAEFPRNALGKVRRDALAKQLQASLRPDYVPPRGAMETLVAQTFASLLDVDRVGRLDNFFALGGDSLRAARAVARIAAEAGVELEPVALFEAPTVEQFARVIAEACREASAVETRPLAQRVHRRWPADSATPVTPTED